ncbi:hypothetical protein CLV51_1021237 [Chitinophaga niastensis]|uniref:DUF2846 domain-containing protein n=1 Tax=Chitinophaga niastensis TaxID=536980 RepID=A0A2P8HQ59_CHINA|nr:hypothetical protein [Chitinophaga niastensis]PSL48370.1 hypothetical protein CLV51_1021237 [Chitinophaga niastensis]
MKRIFLLPVAAAVLLLLSQCNVQGGTMKTYFWTHTHPDSTYYLYINDTYKGVLPYQDNAPTCGTAALQQQTLFIPLPSGTYSIEVKDKQGNVKLLETYKLHMSRGNISLSLTTKMPSVGNKRTASGDCDIEELYF